MHKHNDHLSIFSSNMPAKIATGKSTGEKKSVSSIVIKKIQAVIICHYFTRSASHKKQTNWICQDAEKLNVGTQPLKYKNLEQSVLVDQFYVEKVPKVN